MPIPAQIPTELGRAPMTPAWLRQRFSENRHPPDAVLGGTEMASALGVVGTGWNVLLMAGFPMPCSLGQARVWFESQGWLDD